MAKGRRPKRRNRNAERLTYSCEIELCPHCKARLSAVGCSAHSEKNVQTLKGSFHVLAYSRRCVNPACEKCGTHYHAAGHLKISLPSSTYGLDVVAKVGVERERKHKQFGEIQRMLNEEGIEINERSVGRLYRLYLRVRKNITSCIGCDVRLSVAVVVVVFCSGGVGFDRIVIEHAILGHAEPPSVGHP